VIGAGDHFEIWDAGRWEEYSNRPAFDASPASRAPGRTAGWGQP
jgi:DNA-binding transcriptional regulator/RsmH inhibitor MraZ